jgi:transcriptional regulator with XRE-family HTH domain/tetratricopeptide (TPR) repeat protein
MADPDRRRCARCRRALSRYNPGTTCGPCLRDPRLPDAAELWRTAQVRRALSVWDLATVLTLYRQHTGATQASIATAVGIDQSEVSRLQNKKKKIRDRHQMLAWTNALGVPERLLGPLPDTAAPQLAISFDPGPSRKAIDSWIRGDDGSIGSASPRGLSVTDQDLSVARSTLGMFRQLDHVHGAGHFAGHLTAYVDSELAVLLSRPAAGPDFAQARDRLAAEFLELAGYQAIDSGLGGGAQHYYQRALRSAANAGDVAYGGYLVAVNLGHLALHCGHPRVALEWASAAESKVGTAASPATRAAIAAVAARAQARLGREKESTTLLLRAEALVEAAVPDGEPGWIGYFNRAYLADEIAHCLHDLGRAPAARSEAESALEGVGASHVRRLAIDTTLIASTWLRSGDLERACAAAREAVGYAARTSSGRCRLRITDLLADLGAHAAEPCVAELHEFVHEVLPEAAVTPAR